MSPFRRSARVHFTALACLLLVTVAFALAAASGATLAGSKPLLIRLSGLLAPEIAGRQVTTLAQARRAFGTVALRPGHAASRATCVAAWPALGLVIDFPEAGPAFCAGAHVGPWMEIAVTRVRWHTAAGLAVGDTVRRAHELYPNGRSLGFLGRGPAWQLETGGPMCDGGPPLALAALLNGGRVAELAVLRVPACG